MSGLFDRLQDELNARDDEQSGLSPIDLLDMPKKLANIVNHIIRNNGMKLQDISQEINQSTTETEQMLETLTQKGYVRRVEVKQEVWYKAQFGRKADKTVSENIWSALDSVARQQDDD